MKTNSAVCRLHWCFLLVAWTTFTRFYHVSSASSLAGFMVRYQLFCINPTYPAKAQFVSSWNVSFHPNVFINITGYIIVADPHATCDPILSLSECEAAAVHLGLSDVTAKHDIPNSHGHADPIACYLEQGELKFNPDGSNTGSCGEDHGYGWVDECLCRAGKHWEKWHNSNWGLSLM